jgi:SAM-dependent methyltransferase
MAGVICGCSASSWAQLFDVQGFGYVRCDECGSGRLDPLPESDPVELYTSDYFRGAQNGGYLDYDRDGPMHLRNARTRLDRFATQLPPGPQRMLDIGCASGYALEAASERGWSGVGVDASAYARGQAAGRGHVVTTTIGEGLAALDGPPTVISYFQVLEHLANPQESLDQAAAALAPGGLIVIETWNVASGVARTFGSRWQQANPPSVVHLFSAVGIDRMLAARGVDVVWSRPTTKRVSLGMIAAIAGGRWRSAGALVRPFLQGRLSGATIPYRLGDLITVVGRSNGTR